MGWDRAPGHSWRVYCWMGGPFSGSGVAGGHEAQSAWILVQVWDLEQDILMGSQGDLEAYYLGITVARRW